jgi:hypothetical protein
VDRFFDSPLDNQKHSMDAMLASLQKIIRRNSKSGRELSFLKHTHHYLVASTGHPVKVDEWTITTLDIEFGALIGAGGLFVNATFVIQN